MGMGEAVAMGLQGIRAYKMRAFLTILGVVMGIMTVTGMSSIVAGLNASMARQIATLGSSTIFIRPQAPGENIDDDEWRRRKGLTMDEVADDRRAKPAVAGDRSAAVDPDRDREVRGRARARPAGAGHHRGLRGRPRQLRREGPLPVARSTSTAPRRWW